MRIELTPKEARIVLNALSDFKQMTQDINTKSICTTLFNRITNASTLLDIEEQINDLLIKYDKLQKQATTNLEYKLEKAYSNVVDDLIEILTQPCNDKEEN